MLKVANSVISASRITGVLPVVNGGTGVTTSTGTGNTVLSASPTLSGDVTLSTGNVVIGTAGKGIDFSITSHPAGMTSELFDDYEEGTWTPVITYSGGNGDLSYAAQDGAYTKIGNCVTFNMRLQFGETTASGYIADISGLPFVSSNGGGSGMAIDNMSGLSGGGQWSMTTSSALLFVTVSGTGSAISITASNTGAASNVMRISGIYITAL